MFIHLKKGFSFIVIFFMIWGINTFIYGEDSVGDIPVNDMQKSSMIIKWNIIGPFPNHNLEKPVTPDGASRSGFHKDYLLSLGGETKAKIKKNTTVFFKDEDDKEQTAKVYYIKSKKDMVDFEEIFPGSDNKVAYAFSYIKSTKTQTAYLFFGSDDCPKIWINGKLVHDNWMGGRGMQPREDRLKVKLKKGLNSVLIKVEEGWGDWRFIFEIHNESKGKRLLAEIKAIEKLKKELTTFQNCEIGPEMKWQYIFHPHSFPKIVWKQPYAVKAISGDFPLNITWYNSKLEKVEKPEYPGRYMVYIEGKTLKGIMIRRALTFYCSPPDWEFWKYPPKADLEYLYNSPINKKAWNQRKDQLKEIVGEQFIEYIATKEKGAILMSYLHEIKPLGKKLPATETPEIIHNDYQLALKRKILKVENKYKPLQMPEKSKKRSVVLRKGSLKQAGMKKGVTKNLSNLCKDWYKDTKIPFVTLVARNGIIIFHEAVGKIKGEKIKLDTPFYIASATKAITAMMFAQFMHQGSIKLDDPVGKYLPDFPVQGDKVITLRDCFIHTSGLDGHYLWEGMHNPWLENIIANGLPYVDPGKAFQYNGMGYNLAGKVMEVVSAKSIFRLIHENFFQPLGVKNTTINDLACFTKSTAEDLAIMGQLLLNKGSYGYKEFFSPLVFDEIQPTDLSKFYPDIKGVKWGVGLIPEPGLKFKDKKTGEYKVVKKMVGHGAGIMTMLQIDLDHNIVITQVREKPDDKFDEYQEKLLQVIAEHIQ